MRGRWCALSIFAVPLLAVGGLAVVVALLWEPPTGTFDRTPPPPPPSPRATAIKQMASEEPPEPEPPKPVLTVEDWYRLDFWVRIAAMDDINDVLYMGTRNDIAALVGRAPFYTPEECQAARRAFEQRWGNTPKRLKIVWEQARSEEDMKHLLRATRKR